MFMNHLLQAAEKRTTTVLLLLLAMGAAGTLLIYNWTTDRLVRAMAMDDARVQAKALKEFRTLYTAEVVERVRPHGVTVSHDYKDIEGPSIPLPATFTMMLGSRLGDEMRGGQARLYSDFPFPWRTDRKLDEFGAEAWKTLRANPEKPYHAIEVVKGQPMLRYATADLMRMSCVACHNSHPQSPKTDWREGDVRGVLEVNVPLAAATAQTQKGLMSIFLWMAVSGLVGLAVLGELLRRLKFSRAEATELAERVLRQRQLIVETSMDAVITIDEEGCITEWNSQADLIFGWSRNDALGRSLGELIIPEELRVAYSRGIRHFLKTGEGPVLKRRIEVEAIRKNGVRFPVELAIKPQKDNGKFSFVGFARDITDRREAEKGLIKAKDEAERANTAKTEFLSRISHELRTPMNAVLGFGQLLDMDELNEDQQECVGQIMTAGRHLLGLIDQVLDISQIETGSLPLSPEPVNVAEVVEEVLDLVRPLAEEKGIECRTSLKAWRGCHVLADRQLLKQILLNLASNAIKYNQDAGQVNISFSNAACDRFRIHVADTGPGIAANNLDKVFTPFERLNADRLEVEGTGLGLSLSKSMAEVMDGTLTVESVVGKGCTFQLEIPLAYSQAALEEEDLHSGDALQELQD